MSISVGGEEIGKLTIILYTSRLPKTCQNFTTLLTNGKYNKCPFHRIIKGFMAQGGDYTNNDGTGGESIYGGSFADEGFPYGHDDRGVLSMANSGRDTNGSQFFVTFRAVPHLDGKHVVFGRLEKDEESGRVLNAIEGVSVGKDDVPTRPVVITDCGIISDENEAVVSPTATPVDEDEIDLAEDEEQENEAMEKLTPLQQRLYKLKMKINQSKRLNRKEILEEGARLGSVEGARRHRQQIQQLDKKQRAQEWAKCHEKAGPHAKNMTLTANDALRKDAKKQAKCKAQQFGVNDYHNPQGQFRNYERNLKSLPSHVSAAADSGQTFDHLQQTIQDGEPKNKDGVKRLATELRKRAEKSAINKRMKLDFEGVDVSYVNQRNKRFNEKIGRTYDKYTAEIRQNLERGTAL